jgi:hypothetical protein
VDLHSNDISQLTALVQNSDAGGLGEGSQVNLVQNPLSDQALRDIAYLQSKGVEVSH